MLLNSVGFDSGSGVTQIFAYLFERALRDRPQYGQGSVALHRVLFQFLCDVFSTFMVTPVGEDSANFFQHRIHIGYGTLTQFTHCATSPGA
jgi:hypothetical protein